MYGSYEDSSPPTSPSFYYYYAGIEKRTRGAKKRREINKQRELFDQVMGEEGIAGTMVKNMDDKEVVDLASINTITHENPQIKKEKLFRKKGLMSEKVKVYESQDLDFVIENNTDVQDLTINVNNIRELPSNFGGNNWSQLRVLSISGEKLERLPDNFGANWTHLSRLSIASTKLKTLPDNFGANWPQLDTLYLDTNPKLERLPRNFGANWTQLKTLTLENNPKLERLPTDFGANLPQLRILHLSDTPKLDVGTIPDYPDGVVIRRQRER